MPNEIAIRPGGADDTLLTLQAGRGIAAVAVLLHHACNGVTRQGGYLPGWFVTICEYGYLGVDFFFVLSGFIIYYVNQPRREKPGFTRSYTESRLIRVFVPYLPIGLAVAFAYLALPQLASGDNRWDWFSTLTLLPSSAHPALAPAWTLQHELLFYFVALLAFRLRAFVPISIAAVVVIICVRAFVPMSYKGLGLVDLEFLFGIAAAWCFMNQRATWNWLLIGLGVILCGLFFFIDDRMLSVIFGLGLAFLLLPLIRAERAGFVRVGGALLLVGEASYALYLIHYPLVSGLARILKGFDGWVSYLAIVLMCMIGGIAYHLIFERPALKLTKNFIGRLTGSTSKSSSKTDLAASHKS